MKDLSAKLFNLFLPARCAACGQFTAENGVLCGHCWRGLDFITDPQCVACGFPFYSSGLTGGLDHVLCGACLSKHPVYDQARSVLRYNQGSAPLITGFKYSDKLHMAGLLSQWMAVAGAEMLEKADWLVPVPLHRWRLLSRRYNQAAVLASHIAKKTDVSIAYNMLVRVKNTVPQASLTRKQRLKNVKTAFAIHPKFKATYAHKIKGKHIVLIDDVMTTGATISACAKALKKAGAARVDVLTLARTVLGD